MAGYDEFGMLAENAAEYSIDWSGPPEVRRASVPLDSGLHLSALVWGAGPPELVLVHGGAQNAHTWDTVALALNRPLVAVDLPGHGRSDHRPGHRYGPVSMAADVAAAAAALAPGAEAVVGMSLGGLTAIALAAEHPGLVRRLGVVDVTPGVDGSKTGPIVAFIDGPDDFDSFEAILARTVEHNPGRSEQSLRRGVLHNAHEGPDGRWRWNYDRIRNWEDSSRSGGSGGGDSGSGDGSSSGDGGGSSDRGGSDAVADSGGDSPFGVLWDMVGRLRMPTALWQGGRWSVVDDADIAEWMRRCPQTTHTVVDGAGHSIQGDRPLELAALIEDLLARPA